MPWWKLLSSHICLTPSESLHCHIHLEKSEKCMCAFMVTLLHCKTVARHVTGCNVSVTWLRCLSLSHQCLWHSDLERGLCCRFESQTRSSVCLLCNNVSVQFSIICPFVLRRLSQSLIFSWPRPPIDSWRAASIAIACFCVCGYTTQFSLEKFTFCVGEITLLSEVIFTGLTTFNYQPFVCMNWFRTSSSYKIPTVQK